MAIPSLCETEGAEWYLTWERDAAGELWTGVLWNDSTAGALVGWTTCELIAKCSAFSDNTTRRKRWTSTDSELSLPDTENGCEFCLKSWQGEGHGVQDLVVAFEIVSEKGLPATSTSLLAGYTGEHAHHSPRIYSLIRIDRSHQHSVVE